MYLYRDLLKKYWSLSLVNIYHGLGQHSYDGMVLQLLSPSCCNKKKGLSFKQYLEAKSIE